MVMKGIRAFGKGVFVSGVDNMDLVRSIIMNKRSKINSVDASLQRGEATTRL